MALCFGGATHGDALSSAVVRLVSLPLLGIAIWRIGGSHPPFAARAAIWLLCGVVALILVQLIPLPPRVWSGLPGHGFLVRDYLAAGMAPPSLPLSLAPQETADTLLWLVPPAAMFLATLTLDQRDRGRMLLAIPPFAVVAVALGMMQLQGGPTSALRFYAETNIDAAVGFFANKNHQAALMVAAAALAPLWITRFRRDPQLARFGLILAVAIEIVLIVGIGVTQSRAGVFLAIPALLVGVVIVSRVGRRSRHSALFLFGAALVGAGLVGAFAFTGILGRFQEPLGAESRVETLPTVERAVKAYFPVGSGIGSFDPVYRMFEPPAALSEYYLNHAHDEALEISLEAGAPGLALMIAFVVWWIWSTARLWRTRRDGHDDGMAASASLVIGLLLAHSIVDYPLRTEAMATIFALACGILATAEVGVGAPVRRRESPAQPDLLASKLRVV